MKTALKTTSALFAFAAFATASAHAETIHSVTQIKYDNNNRPTCSAVRMNPANYGSLPADACALGAEGSNGPDRITRTWYNNAGEVTQVDEAYGTAVQRPYARYYYNNNGTKLYEVSATTYTTQYNYDGFDRVKRVHYPCPTTQNCANGSDYEEYGYDAADNMTTLRRRDGDTITYTYDNLNRATVKDIPGGTASDVYSTYDGLGRVTSNRFASFSGSGITYAYDGLGRVTSTTDMNSRTISYQYNSAGARTRLTFPDSNNIGYGLDNANRVTTIGWGTTSGIYAQGFNNLGQRTWEAKGGQASVTYAYDGIGRLGSMTNDFNGSASDITWGFSYNPAGQLITTTTSSDLYDYEELSSITEPSQAHDGLNRLSTLVGATGICPSGGYDTRANLICDGTGRSYTYDVENRLLTGNIGGNSLSLTYDPEGRLASYSWNGGVTTFLYDGINLIGEYNSSSQMLRRYVHGPGTDNPVVWYEGSGNATLRYFYTNQQGSVITTSDSSGNRGDIYAYGAYGEPKDQYGFTYWPGIGTGSTSVSRFGYTGQMFLADARLYYYKARIYDPQLGRFLQTDPIGSADDLNLYAYVGGDPVNLTDPFGLTAFDGFSSNHLASDTQNGDVIIHGKRKNLCSGLQLEYCAERGRMIDMAERDLDSAAKWRKDDPQALKLDCELAEQNRDTSLAMVKGLEAYETAGNIQLGAGLISDAIAGTIKVGRIVKDLVVGVVVSGVKGQIRTEAVKSHEKAKILKERMKRKGVKNTCNASGGI